MTAAAVVPRQVNVYLFNDRLYRDAQRRLVTVRGFASASSNTSCRRMVQVLVECLGWGFVQNFNRCCLGRADIETLLFSLGDVSHRGEPLSVRLCNILGH